MKRLSPWSSIYCTFLKKIRFYVTKYNIVCEVMWGISSFWRALSSPFRRNYGNIGVYY